jgi:hypothetical protein
MRRVSPGDGTFQRNSTTQVEAGNSSSVYGPFETVGGGVRVRFGQAAQQPSAIPGRSLELFSKDRQFSSRLSLYFQAAQKGMR